MKKAKFIVIADEIAADIRNGAFRFGDRLYSRKELMLKYHIGENTANRVQQYLAEQNYVRKVKGGGIYVSCCSNGKTFAVRLNEPPARKIESLEIFRMTSGNSQPQTGFNSLFYNEIDRCMQKSPLQCKYHEYTSMQISDTQIPVLPTKPNTGYLGVSIGPITMFYTASIFLNPLLHNVMLDWHVPGSNAILTDSVDGMEKLVAHALERGFRRFIVTRNFSSSLGEFYDHERFDAACRYIRSKGMYLQTLETGSFTELITMVSAEKQPFCVMFMQDEQALRFCHLTASLKLSKHLVTGFNNYVEAEKPDFPVATIAVDHKAMVQAAFRLLEAPMAHRKEIIRIPGTFMPEIQQ